MSASGNLLQIFEGSKAYGAKELFRNASFSINEEEHIGVIGPNGAGKTTLFKVLVGEADLDEGRVVTANHLRIGYLQQHDLWEDGETVEDFLQKGTQTPIWDLKKLGEDLGLTQEMYSQPIASLSGGYRMRAKLLHLLGEEPNLMLLDEPTNYLDLETLLVLETFLQSYKGAFLLISHDREFLRRTTDHILEIENGDFTKYNGSIDDYFEQKALLRKQTQAAAAAQAAKRKDILDFAARFGAKATKAKQVQSRLKRLDKMESIEIKPLPVAAKISIPEPHHTGKMSLEVKNAALGYGSDVILDHVDLKVARGDHLGVVGFNGAGKSTLLKALAQKLAPMEGSVELGYQVETSYFAQHVPESLDPEKTVLQELRKSADPQLKTQEILDLAGSLLFQGADVEKKIKVLSGGEKSRVALGQILLKRSPVLLLDEPTNHLDFFTVEALTQALEAYPGSLITVSHDRGFIRRVANKILEVDSGRVHVYPGSYDQYVWSVQKRERQPTPAEPRRRVVKTATAQKEVEKTPSVKHQTLQKEVREKIKQLKKKQRENEKRIKENDQKIKVLQKMIEETSQKLQESSGEDATKLAQELSATQKKLESLEESTIDFMEDTEKIEDEIQSLRST